MSFSLSIYTSICLSSIFCFFIAHMIYDLFGSVSRWIVVRSFIDHCCSSRVSCCILLLSFPSFTRFCCSMSSSSIWWFFFYSALTGLFSWDRFLLFRTDLTSFVLYLIYFVLFVYPSRQRSVLHDTGLRLFPPGCLSCFIQQVVIFLLTYCTLKCDLINISF